MTLGVTLGDVGAWLFTVWLCIDWFYNLDWVFNLDLLKGTIMKAMFKTGMDALAVLWGLGASSHANQCEKAI